MDSTQFSNEKHWCNNDLQVLRACDVGVNGEGVRGGGGDSQEMVAFHHYLSSPLPSPRLYTFYGSTQASFWVPRTCQIPSALGIPQNTDSVKEGQRHSLNLIAVHLSHFGGFPQTRDMRKISLIEGIDAFTLRTFRKHIRGACKSHAI